MSPPRTTFFTLRLVAAAALLLGQAAAQTSAASNGSAGESVSAADSAGSSESSGFGGRCETRPVLTCFLAATQSADASGQPSRVAGTVGFAPFFDASVGSCRTRITGSISGLGTTIHGWHVHQKGDISGPTGLATGDHYNPFNNLHGIPGVDRRTHEGDLGNLQPDASGTVTLNLVSRINTALVLGRGLIIHALRDQGSSQQPVGQSGARLGQCVLGRTDV